MRIFCARCGRPGDASEVDLGQNLLLCRHCGDLTPLAVAGERIAGGVILAPEDFSPQSPPAGAWYEAGADGVRAGAVCGGGSGFSSRLFLGLALLLFSAVAVWLYCGLAGMDERNGWLRFFSGMLAVVALGPFLALFGSFFLLTMFGKTELFFSACGGWVRTGIGPLGWRVRFDPADLTGIYWHRSQRETSRVLGKVVSERCDYCPELRRRTGKTIPFASLCSPARQEYLGYLIAQLWLAYRRDAEKG